MAFDDLYRETILDHFQNPRNYGRIANPDVSFEDKNPLCGDIIRFEVKLDGTRKRVQEAKFSGQGCAISQAAASMLTENVQGKTLSELEKLDKKDVLDLLGVEPGVTRLKCAMLGLKALKLGLLAFQGKTPGKQAQDL